MKSTGRSWLITGIIFLLTNEGCLSFRSQENREIRRFAQKGIDLHPGNYRVNNLTIHYVQTGLDTLPTVIFIHGSPGSWTSFREYQSQPELLFHFRLISVDRPGFGDSDYGNVYTLAEQSILLRPLFSEIDNGKPVFLVGHSLGGSLVLKMAADYPEQIDGIMMMSAPVNPALEPAEDWRKLFVGTPLQSKLPGAFQQSNAELYSFKQEIHKLRADFPLVKADVSIVHGDDDSWVPVGNADYARNNLLHARSIHTLIIPEGSHLIPATHRRLISGELIALKQRSDQGRSLILW
jgi:pimeloyl-ACP methyl ester carboxylesterase